MTPDKDLASPLAKLALNIVPRSGFDAMQDALYDAYISGDLITRAEADAMVAAERERIIAALREEASVCPCDEDQVVIADCADLIEADFSYDDCEKLKVAREAAAIRAAQPAPAKGGE